MTFLGRAYVSSVLLTSSFRKNLWPRNSQDSIRYEGKKNLKETKMLALTPGKSLLLMCSCLFLHILTSLWDPEPHFVWSLKAVRKVVSTQLTDTQTQI